MAQQTVTAEKQKSRKNEPRQYEELKVKEKIGSDVLISILKKWVESLEHNKDWEFQLKGATCYIPKEALMAGRTKAEFESDDGEYEFSLKFRLKS